MVSSISCLSMFIDTNYQGNNSDGTYEKPFTTFLVAFSNLPPKNNWLLLTSGNVLNDIQIPLIIQFPLTIMSFGFESEENAILNIYSEGSFQIFEQLFFRKINISLHNSVHLKSFMLLMDNASLTMQVHYFHFFFVLFFFKKEVSLVFEDKNLVFPDYFFMAYKNSNISFIDSSLHISVLIESFCFIQENSSLKITNFEMDLKNLSKMQPLSFWTIFSSNTSINNLTLRLFNEKHLIFIDK